MINTNTVEKILSQKLKLMQQFCELTELLQHALRDEDMQKINDLLDARQRVINHIDELDGQLADYRPALACACPNPVNGNRIGDMRQVEEKIQECLMRARELDREIQETIKQKYQGMVKNIGTVRVARRAETMYRKKAASRYGYFVDKKK